MHPPFSMTTGVNLSLKLRLSKPVNRTLCVNEVKRPLC